MEKWLISGMLRRIGVKEKDRDMNNRMMNLFLLLGSAAVLSACQDDSRIAEVSTQEAVAQMEVQKRYAEEIAKKGAEAQMEIERKYAEEISKKGTQAQLETEQKFKAALSNDMETDLTRRQRFYQGVAGVYEGTIQTKSGNFNMRIRLVPSLPLYKNTRIRMQEEIAEDLNKLYFNAQIIQWTPGSNLGAVGCRVSEIRADIDQGQISIASPDCPNFYQIQVNEEAPIVGHVSQDTRGERSRRVAQGILEGSVANVKFLEGVIQPTSTSEQYVFQVARVVAPSGEKELSNGERQAEMEAQ